MTPPVVALVEPNLIHARGHHLGYVTAIGRELRARGSRVRIAGPTRAEPAVRSALLGEGFEFEPLFGPNPLAAVRLRGGGFVGAAAAYGRGLGALTASLGPRDRIIAVSGDAQHLAGAAAAMLARRHAPPLDFVMYGWELDGPGAPRAHGFRHALTLPLLRQCAQRGRIRLWGQTRPVRDDIATETGVDVGNVPLIVDWSHAPGGRPPRASSAVRVGFMGEARAEKGFTLWVEAMERLGAEVEAAGRISRPVTLEPHVFDWQIDRLRRSCACTFELGACSAAEYYAAFAALDIVVLAYAPSMYGRRTSNILVEAIGLGVVPVVSADTWLEAFAREQGLHTSFDAGSVDALVACLRRSIDGLDGLRSHVDSAASVVRATHNVVGFVDALGLG